MIIIGWFWETEEETNNQKDSKKILRIKPLTFKELWDSYPSSSPVHKDANGEDFFNDHCAINVSDAFLNLGIQMKSFKGKRCYGSCKHDNKHALVAQELADWIKLKPFPGCPTAQVYTGETFEENIKGKTGIVFFKDYWPRDPNNKSIRTGDHIDLWNEDELASRGYIETQFRLAFPDFLDYIGYSSLMKSKEVLFWEIK
ncbi:hypothetical protein HYE60_01825 [Aggregatibacter actinomycetemcomitans]|uniref:T6SS effector amidase Tae4 family protein n=1 Tax=Aggregatibacter actinomycetemcomitans TaxID=714 RepID=UPI00197CB0BD|nr:hypothetical protein [Aggregatibacter actinomycetemcomitans]